MCVLLRKGPAFRAAPPLPPVVAPSLSAAARRAPSSVCCCFGLLSRGLQWCRRVVFSGAVECTVSRTATRPVESIRLSIRLSVPRYGRRRSRAREEALLHVTRTLAAESPAPRASSTTTSSRRPARRGSAATPNATRGHQRKPRGLRWPGDTATQGVNAGERAARFARAKPSTARHGWCFRPSAGAMARLPAASARLSPPRSRRATRVAARLASAAQPNAVMLLL